MKKAVGLILCVVMIVGNCMVATAGTAGNPHIGPTEPAGGWPVDNNVQVDGEYKKSTAKIYSIDLTWGNMNFTYTPSVAGDWDPATLQYKNDTGTGDWDVYDVGIDDNIKIVNRSNSAIYTKLIYTQDSNYSSVTGTFTKDSFSLPSAEGMTKNVDDVDDGRLVGSSTFNLSGNPGTPWYNSIKIGGITIKISNAAIS